ncbi:MAG TPA: CrcB family protein, partial [Actinoplanes sp.]
MTLLLVMLGGAVGALARYAADRMLPAWEIPLATLIVNVAGSFLLGFLAGAGSAVPGPVGALLGTGFCGALTTWSTFAFQTVDLAGHGGRRMAVL